MLGPYDGIKPFNDISKNNEILRTEIKDYYRSVEPIEPQLDFLKFIMDKMSKSYVDAITLSAGGNDVSFGAITRSLVLEEYDDVRSKEHGHNEQTLRNKSLNVLKNYFGQKLNTALTDDIYNQLALGLKDNTNKVIYTKYPDPTYGDEGKDSFCKGAPADGMAGKISKIAGYEISVIEAEFARENIVKGLNDIIEHKCKKYKWNCTDFVSDGKDSFSGHGYCLDRSKVGAYAYNTSFFRDFNDSMLYQGDQHGVMHPSRSGHELYAEVIIKKADAINKDINNNPTWKILYSNNQEHNVVSAP